MCQMTHSDDGIAKTVGYQKGVSGCMGTIGYFPWICIETEWCDYIYIYIFSVNSDINYNRKNVQTKRELQQVHYDKNMVKRLRVFWSKMEYDEIITHTHTYICTWLCCALFCCGYICHHPCGLMWFINPYSLAWISNLIPGWDMGPFFTRVQYWPSGIVVACVCVYVCLSVNHELVRAIIHQPFKLGSPNLDQRCKRPWLRSLLFCGVIDGDLQCQIELESQNLPHFWLVSLSGR